jgi:hypothetical protein
MRNIIIILIVSLYVAIKCMFIVEAVLAEKALTVFALLGSNCVFTYLVVRIFENRY